MENWIYYKLTHDKNNEVELLCTINTSTIDDDEPNCEYYWCDGVWRQQIPYYWSIDSQDVTPLLNELISISAMEWSFIAQAIVDCETNKVFIHHFENCTLQIGYDYEQF